MCIVLDHVSTFCLFLVVGFSIIRTETRMSILCFIRDTETGNCLLLIIGRGRIPTKYHYMYICIDSNGLSKDFVWWWLLSVIIIVSSGHTLWFTPLIWEVPLHYTTRSPLYVRYLPVPTVNNPRVPFVRTHSSFDKMSYRTYYDVWHYRSQKESNWHERGRSKDDKSRTIPSIETHTGP